MTINQHQLTNDIHKKIIDAILASSLNISFIPDDIERELYESVFNIVTNTVKSDKFISWLCCKNKNKKKT